MGNLIHNATIIIYQENLLRPSSLRQWLDMGSFAGTPAIPLAADYIYLYNLRCRTGIRVPS